MLDRPNVGTVGAAKPIEAKIDVTRCFTFHNVPEVEFRWGSKSYTMRFDLASNVAFVLHDSSSFTKLVHARSLPSCQLTCFRTQALDLYHVLCYFVHLTLWCLSLSLSRNQRSQSRKGPTVCHYSSGSETDFDPCMLCGGQGSKE